VVFGLWVRSSGDRRVRGDDGLDIITNGVLSGTETPGRSQAGSRCRILQSMVSQAVAWWDGMGWAGRVGMMCGWAGIGACHDAGLSATPPLFLSFCEQGYVPIWSVFPEGLELLDSA
jgi:hypothetical protein